MCFHTATIAASATAISPQQILWLSWFLAAWRDSPKHDPCLKQHHTIELVSTSGCIVIVFTLVSVQEMAAVIDRFCHRDIIRLVVTRVRWWAKIRRRVGPSVSMSNT